MQVRRYFPTSELLANEKDIQFSFHYLSIGTLSGLGLALFPIQLPVSSKPTQFVMWKADKNLS